MLDAVAAEALKMRRHRGTWLMVWIFPIAIFLIALASLVYYQFAPASPPADPQSAAAWIADSAIFWRAPGSAPGRILIAGFAALLFAGEYSWNTWKLIIPARERWQLIVAKWTVAVGFVFAAFVLTDLINLTTEWLRSLQDSAIPEDVTLSGILAAHARAAAYALLPIAYATAFAALFAVLTRSILATVIVSIGLVIMEGMLAILGVFFHARAPELTRFLIETLPPYHMLNLIEWANRKTGLVSPLGPEASVALGWTTSLTALVAWIGLAMAITLVRFSRQDLN
ncbi:MAG: ABC transporter permease subunit [Sphingomonadales bacterium]|nr:ABC transporter permease subunit [Sphingomonadales bacterium]